MKDIPFDISRLTRVLEIIREAKEVLESGGVWMESSQAKASYLESGRGGIKVVGVKKPWMAIHFEKAIRPNPEYPDWGPFFPDIKSFFFAEADQRMGAWILDVPRFLSGIFASKKKETLEFMMAAVEESLQTEQWNLSQERARISNQFEVSLFSKDELQRAVIMINFGPLKSITMVETPIKAPAKVA